MKKRGKADAVLLAIALFSVSGAALAYNLATVAGEDIAVFLSAGAKDAPRGAELISECAAANIIGIDAVAVDAEPHGQPETVLLPPIVTAPQR